MADPMDALRKSTGISANPRPNVLDQEPIDPSQIQRGEMPLTPNQLQPILESLGKPIAELLGMVLRPTQARTGLPSRLRFSNYNAEKGLAQFHADTKAAPQFEATPQQLDELIGGGALDLEQPPQGAVDAIRRKLAALLGP